MSGLQTHEIDPLTSKGPQIDEEIEVTLIGREHAADGVVLLTFKSTESQPLPEWQPGAHIDVVISDEVIRQYSLCGSPGDRTRFQIGVLLEDEGRGGSKYLFENCQVGTTLKVGGPRNHFQLVEADEYVFIAGGIGITPLYPMIQSLERDHKSWKLYYAGRSQSTMLFREALSLYAENVQFAVKDENSRLDIDAIFTDLTGHEAVYCCGPERLMDAVEEASKNASLGSALHLERFTPLEFDQSANKPFEIELERSNLTLHVPENKTTMEVMNEAGIYVPTSCAAGTCGSCEVDVLEGIPEHRDSVLTAEEREENFCMMVCVSRAKSDRLVLDI